MQFSRNIKTFYSSTPFIKVGIVNPLPWSECSPIYWRSWAKVRPVFSSYSICQLHAILSITTSYCGVLVRPLGWELRLWAGLLPTWTRCINPPSSMATRHNKYTYSMVSPRSWGQYSTRYTPSLWETSYRRTPIVSPTLCGRHPGLHSLQP